MENLKIIWQKANDLKLDTEDLLEMNTVTSIFSQIKKEEERRKNWLPWMITYYLGITLFSLWFYNWLSQTWYNRSLSTLQIIATLLILVGGFVILYLKQLHKIPLAVYEHDQASESFLKIVKKQLAQKRKMVLLSNCIYVLILTIAINIISYDWSAPYAKGNWSYLLLLNGLILFIAIIYIPLGLKKFDSQYKEILNRIDQFLAKE